MSAQDFNCKNLCICYFVKCENNWICFNGINDDLFYGVTNKCYTNKHDFACFSSLFEIQLQCDFNIWHDIFINKWPILYLKVLSIDYWNRLISESYGYVEVPKKPGRYSISVTTWKSHSTHIVDKLKNFFIGYSSRMENIFESPFSSNQVVSTYYLYYNKSRVKCYF